ncbi:hypothetical protein E2C01_056351 [Portunus trituberculatus]|uniref:Uncharacterized protein n=1 Tax=Portunus trituberculatus TaxID=210409 RepID=A0A5B7GZE0_PORTR|nr:hypothetical protein [Portunus trituberculatus]
MTPFQIARECGYSATGEGATCLAQTLDTTTTTITTTTTTTTLSAFQWASLQVPPGCSSTQAVQCQCQNVM